MSLAPPPLNSPPDAHAPPLLCATSMALAPEQKLTYKEAGPAGVAAFEAGVAGQEARAFRGCG